MLELKHSGHFLLTQEILLQVVPSLPGVYTLAAKSRDGNLEVFDIKQTNNLRTSLQRVLE